MAHPLLGLGIRQGVKFVGKKAGNFVKKGMEKVMELNAKRGHNTGKGMSFEPKGLMNKVKNRFQKKEIEKQFAAQGRPKQQTFEITTKQSTDTMTLIQKKTVKVK